MESYISGRVVRSDNKMSASSAASTATAETESESVEELDRRVTEMWGGELSAFFDSKYCIKDYLGDSGEYSFVTKLPRDYMDKEDYVQERARLKEKINVLKNKIASKREAIRESSECADEIEEEIRKKSVEQCKEKIKEYSISLENTRYYLLLLYSKTPVHGRDFTRKIEAKCSEYLELLERRADLQLAKLETMSDT